MSHQLIKNNCVYRQVNRDKVQIGISPDKFCGLQIVTVSVQMLTVSFAFLQVSWHHLVCRHKIYGHGIWRTGRASRNECTQTVLIHQRVALGTSRPGVVGLTLMIATGFVFHSLDVSYISPSILVKIVCGFFVWKSVLWKSKLVTIYMILIAIHPIKKPSIMPRFRSSEY